MQPHKNYIPSKKKSQIKFIVILFLIFLFLLLIGAYFLMPRIWNGRSKFSIVSQNISGEVNIEILDPVASTVTNIKIPSETEVEAANNLGIWKLGSITKLAEDKNLKEVFLKDTVIKSLFFPIDAWEGKTTNLTIFDKLKIKLFILSIPNSGKINIDLSNSSFLRRAQLTDGTLGWVVGDKVPANIETYFTENFKLNAVIKNSSGRKSGGVLIGNVLETLGINVVSLQSLDRGDFDCKVITRSEQAADKIASVFNCSKEIKAPGDNFDLEIDLGSRFTSRF